MVISHDLHIEASIGYEEYIAINLSCASMFPTFFLLDNALFPGAIDLAGSFWSGSR